jgi:hypothetical protein
MKLVRVMDKFIPVVDDFDPSKPLAVQKVEGEREKISERFSIPERRIA